MGKRIKVKVEGKSSETNFRLFGERLAIILVKELGEDNCKELLEMLKNERRVG